MTLVRPPPTATKGRYANGFTLVETLVALALGALLLTGLAGFVGSLGAQWRATRVEAADREQRTRLVATLDRLIGDAIASAAGERRFAGTSDQLRMTIVAPAAVAAAGLDTNGLLDIRLFRAGSELRAAAVASAEQLPAAVLATGIVSVSFEYAAAAEGGLLWQTQWPAAAAPPPLTRITVRYRDGEPVIAVAAPRRTVDPRCQLDLVALSCRL